MKISRLLPLLAILALSVSSARADYILTLQQVGPNVVATGSGAFNLTGLSSLGGVSFFSARIRADLGLILLTTGGASGSTYSGLTGPANFGIGGTFLADTNSGDAVAIIGSDGQIGLPQGYISNNALSSSATWNLATFASLGVTPGTYVWSWGAGGMNQTFTLVIGGATVPESGSTIALLFLSAGALFGARRFRISRQLIPVADK